MQKLHLPTLLIIALLFLFSSKTEAQSSKKLIKEAQSFYALQNYNDALTKLGEALQLESGNEDALFLRGKVYQAKNECAKAIADFQSAASKMPKNSELFDSMAHCQAELGSTNDALISIDRVIQLSPKNLSYRHFKMSILMNQRKFDQTVATADQALLVDKEDDYSFYLKANAVDSLGNTALAETYFAKALSLALDDKAKKQNGSLLHPYYIGLANSQKKLFKKQESVQNYTKALEWNPANLQALINRGEVYLDMQDYQAAIADFTKVIAMNGKKPEAFYHRGLVNQRLGQFASAINDFNQAILLNESNASYFQGRASCYFATGDFAAATRDYKKALLMLPGDAELNKAYAEARQKKYDSNREQDEPAVLVTQPKLIDGKIEVRADAEVLEFKAQVTDASPIKSIVLDGKSMPVEEEEMNPVIQSKINLSGKSDLALQITDVYLNSKEIRLPIIKTEVGLPSVNISSPYQTIENELFIENTASIMIEGKISDESLIRSIIINGTSASFPLDMKNPSFQALVSIGTKDSIDVRVTDAYGNESSSIYKLIREDTSGANPMGRTWVIFIENSNYKNLQKLEGPARDVADMRVALSNYKVDKIIHKKDLTKAELDKFFSIDLRDQVQKNHVKSIIIWYAGHGKFLNETGYWIPVDGDNYDEFTYYSVNNLRAAIQAYTFLKHVLVISDACESGPAFYMAMRDELTPRVCDDWEVTKFRSAQVITSSNKELSSDNSLFSQAFVNTLNNNPNDCISIEAVTLKVMGIVKQNQKQTPKFGKIRGLDDENGSFFFIKKKF